MLHERGWRLVRQHPSEHAERDGRSYPTNAETMIGRARLDNLEHAVDHVVQNRVPATSSRQVSGEVGL